MNALRLATAECAGMRASAEKVRALVGNHPRLSALRKTLERLDRELRNHETTMTLVADLAARELDRPEGA